MTVSPPARLPSRELEDLVFFALSARADLTDLNVYPDLDDGTRTRLRARIKQISRYDWPASLGDDPDLRRGYTLRQCFRLMIVMQMLDAHLPPSLSVQVARSNDGGLMRLIADRLRRHERSKPEPADRVVIMRPAELRDLTPAAPWNHKNSLELQYVQRERCSAIIADAQLPGPRLVFDFGAAAATVWRWLSSRMLLNDTARTAFIAEIDGYRDEHDFVEQPITRRVKV